MVGEEAQHLQLRVDAGLETPEHLQDRLVVEDDRRVRLLGADPPDVDRLAAQPREVRDSVELDDSLPAVQRLARTQRAHELPREGDVVVDLDLVSGRRVEQLVEVVRAGLVAHLDERERERRLARAHDHRVEHLRVSDAARLRAVPALPHHLLDQDAFVEAHGVGRLQLEPEEPPRREREQVGQLPDRWEARAAEHLLGDHTRAGREVELDGLGRPRDVVDAEDDVVLPAPDVGEDARVVGAKRLVAAEAEHGMLLAQRDEAGDPAQERRRRAQLRFDVHRLVAVDRVHQRLEVELRPVGVREARVAVARPLHRRAHAVPVAEVDVVAHADLVAVVEDGRSRQREEDRVHELDLVPPVVEQRREAPADAEVEPHPRVLRVLAVHVVALVVGDHLERQLVVVAQEEPPLRVLRDARRPLEDLVDRRRVLTPHRHEHARHQREVERHVALGARFGVAEVGDDVLGPLIRLGEEHAVRVVRVDLRAHALQIRVRGREVLAVRPVVLVEVRHGVEPEAVDAEVEPEAEDVEHRVLHVRVLVVEIRLVMEEAVPVVLAAHRDRTTSSTARCRRRSRGRRGRARRCPTRRTSRSSARPCSRGTPGTTDARTTCGS